MRHYDTTQFKIASIFSKTMYNVFVWLETIHIGHTIFQTVLICNVTMILQFKLVYYAIVDVVYFTIYISGSYVGFDFALVNRISQQLIFYDLIRNTCFSQFNIMEKV